jgi:hypothetical protein
VPGHRQRPKLTGADGQHDIVLVGQQGQLLDTCTVVLPAGESRLTCRSSPEHAGRNSGASDQPTLDTDSSMGLPNEHSVTVRIERRDAVPAEASTTAAHTLREQVKIHVGSTCTVDVVEPGTLERSHGKLRRIYDLRPKI